MTSPVGSVGTVSAEVVPDLSQFDRRMRDGTVPAAIRVGREIAKELAAPIAQAITTAVLGGLRGSGLAAAATAAGADAGRRFSSAFRAQARNLSATASVHVDTAELRELRTQLAALRDRTVVVTARTRGSAGPSGGGAPQGSGARDGDDYAGSFAHAVQARLAAASQSLQRPDIGLGLNASQFDRDMGRVRTQIAEMSHLRVGIDISVDDALARMAGLQARVEALRAASPTIQVRIDTAAALAEIQAIHEMINREIGTPAGREMGGAFGRSFRRTVEESLLTLPAVDVHANGSEAHLVIASIRGELTQLSHQEIGIDVNASFAMTQLDRMLTRLRELAATSPDIQIQADTLAAAARIEAFQEQIRNLHGNVDVDTGAAVAQIGGITLASAAAQVGLAGVGFAGAAMATILVPAAAACAVGVGAIAAGAVAATAGLGVLALGLMPVIATVKAMVQQQGKAGTSAATLAGRQNAVANSASQLAAAQDTLRNAQERALIAQQQLTAARVAAKVADEDLASQIAGGALSQRKAALDQADAEVALNAIKAAGVSEQARARIDAQLAYDEATQQVEDLALRQGRLVAQQQQSQQVGIEGSPQVAAAKQGISQAQQQVVTAQRGVASARRSGAQAGIAAAAGPSGVDKVAQAMGALSPAGQAFATFLFSLKPVFEELSRVAQTGFLPGLQAGMKALLPVMPQITAAVGAVAKVMGSLFESAGKALASPFWVNFFQQMTDLAIPILTQMGPTIGNLAKGFAGLLLAFAPMAPVLGQVLLSLSQKFADFATGLTSNPGFQKFVDYAIANAPMLMDLFTNLAIIVLKLLIAFAPFADIMLRVAVAVADWLAKMDPSVLLAIAGAIIVVVGICMSGAMLIGAGIAVIVAAVVYAWTHFKTFRTVVTEVWSGIVVAATFYWNALKATFEFLRSIIMDVVVPAALWLWHNVMEPAWAGIQVALAAAWAVIKPIFDAIGMVINQVLIPAFLWFWHNAIEPAWTGISIIISIAWAGIQIVFGLIVIAVKIVAAIFMFLWRDVIEPCWRGIAAVAKFVYDNTLKPLFEYLGSVIQEHVVPAFKTGVDAIGKAWDAIKDLAKTPIKFIVETVLNKGLIAGYNKLADLFGVNHVDPIKLPDGFATGGLIRGAGTGTSDSILARVSGGPMIRVSNGEYIVPERVVSQYGVGFFDRLAGRSRSRRPGDGSQGMAFSDGGILDFAGDLWGFVTDPIGHLRQPLNAAIDAMPGGPWVRDVVSGTVKQEVTNLVNWVTGSGGPSSTVGKTQAFLRAQNGKPYLWAAAGPDGYDCSGIVSAAYNVMHGRNPYSHTFSTANEAGFFPLPGKGLFTAGWAGPGEKGGGSVGHTAAILAGLGIESTGAGGVRIGAGTTDPASFAHIGHYDSGGWLPKGLSTVFNGTGQPEAVFTGGQLADMKSAAGRQRTPGDEIHFHGTGAGISEVQAFMDRRSVLQRAGRSR